MSAKAKKPTDSKVPDVASSMREFAKSGINKDLTPETRLLFYRDMLRIRRFEERSIRAYQQGHIGGFLHLYIGQEAVAVGCVSLMAEDDHIITAYRLLQGQRRFHALFRPGQELLGWSRHRCWPNSSWGWHCICA